MLANEQSEKGMGFNMETFKQNNDVFKETLIILAYFNNNLLEKIPNKVLKKLNELAAESKAEFYIDREKNLNEQNISEETKDLISLIYYNYIAEQNEKDEILKLWQDNEKRHQEILKQKYNTDELFKGRQKKIDTQDMPSPEKALVEYKKDNIFKRIVEYIKGKLKINR